MDSLQLKLTPSIVRELSRLERLVGQLELLDSLPAERAANHQLELKTEFVRDLAWLDPSARLNQEGVLKLLDSTPRFPATFEILEPFIAGLLSEGGAKPFRDTGLSLFSGGADAELIFTGVQPYLVTKRTRELLNWVQSELLFRGSHPLLVASVFQLVFLQSLPFKHSNHAISHVLLRLLLIQEEHSIFRWVPILSSIREDKSAYLGALKHGEKTVYSNWSTLNVWIEYFLSLLDISLHETKRRMELKLNSSTLSPLQQQLIEIIRTDGPSSRENLVVQTGISESTVKYNLRLLSERGYLRRFGSGRSTTYRLN